MNILDTFPSRLLQPSVNQQDSCRKVRPVALQPPPGIDKPGSSYLEFVKQRAIAGALAGDWSTGRELPDIPSTLLAQVDVQKPSLRRVYSEEDVVNMCSNETFAQANSSAFNVPVGDFSRKSPGVIGKSSIYIPPPKRSQMDARLTAPAVSLSVSDVKQTPVNQLVFGTVPKRRLAPTQITIDSLFPNASQWRQKFAVIDELSQSIDGLHIKQDFTYFSKSPVAKSALTESIKSSPPKQLPVVPVKIKIPPAPPSAPSHRLAQRQKQIDIGKNTPEYRNYISQYPDKNLRRAGDPQTPDKWQDISKRNWEGQMKKWRRTLHMFDPVQVEEENKENVLDVNGQQPLEEGEIVESVVGK